MKTLQINALDNVAVALEDNAGIPRGHKIALQAIPRGSEIIKYGYPIGIAVADIPAGSHVHSHNMRTALDISGDVDCDSVEFPAATGGAQNNTDDLCTGWHFNGYRRPDGKVGIRNELWVIPTVGCINRTAEQIARQINVENPPGADFGGAVALTHPFGCSQLAGDHENTRAILARLAEHPNAGAVLVVGLGCENNTLDGMREAIKRVDNIEYLSAQQPGDEVAAAVAVGNRLVRSIRGLKREACALSDLVIGLKCGGSDGLSGITANPLVGKISDIVAASGGTAVLTEVPEMFGAERALFAQCRDKEILSQACAMVDEFKEYYRKHDLPVYENPSPGNKAGGITTLEDKSLGCVQKGGRGIITAVLKYGQAVKCAGLNLLSGPGNDLIAATALAAAGCQMILFTTGRGTPFGTVAPTMKISTNKELAVNKPHWIDFDAGILVDGAGFTETAGALLAEVAAVAGGKFCKAELNGYKDIAIWKTGVVL